MRVLIVDDYAVVRRGMREILEDHYAGVAIDEAADTAAAIEAVRRNDWDLLLLDLNLPGRGGMEVLHQARELKPRLPVLVMSIHPEDPFGARVIKAGAAGYMTKESAPAELVAAIDRVLGGGRYVSARLAAALADALQWGEQAGLPSELSHREFQVLCRLASGRTVKQVGAELALSVKTVSTYRTRLLQKLRLRSTADLVRYAVEHGLVP